MTGIRRGQLVTPFGVGAVVDIGSEAFACVDISQWRDEETVLLEPSALAQQLRCEVRAPVNAVPFYRFPRWCFCPQCRRMIRIDDAIEKARQNAAPDKPHMCPHCKNVALAPMGFVQACEDGHMDDVDWYRWAHRSQQPATQGTCTRGTAQLEFQTSGAIGGDWGTLVIRCGVCGSSSSLDGLTTAPLPWSCSGKQPWQKKGEDCKCAILGIRRGSSNLYYPEVWSAIDVEPAAGGAEGALAVVRRVRTAIEQSEFGPKVMLENYLRSDPTSLDTIVHALRPKFEKLADELRVPRNEVEEAFVRILAGEEKGHEAPQAPESSKRANILIQEWRSFARAYSLHSEKLTVIPRAVEMPWGGVRDPLVTRIAAVPRLREVRALKGFRRVRDAGSDLTPVDASGDKPWLPGVEVWGEAVFLEFNEEAIRKWEEGLPARVVNRVHTLEAGREAWQDPVIVSARFIALHTLSHLIMRRLSYEAGYSSSSLRERIYAANGPMPMAGILIYTADADSEGSLGGLVRMADPERMSRVVHAALNEGSWCSADPVCGETERQGHNGRNGAACHACALVSETSCPYRNELLDRRMLLAREQAPFDTGLIRRLE